MTARDHLALALDVDDLHAARRLGSVLHPWFGVFKVGLELYAAEGPAALRALRGDAAVFADLKLHDIPTTVGKAARVLGRLGATYVTAHAAGGEAMLRAAVEALAEGSAAAEVVPPRPPGVLAVTVLTSEAEADPGVVAARVEVASAAGCVGVVCSPHEAAAVHALAPSLLVVTPGIRQAGAGHDDQARVASPAAALRAGAGLLVVGRTVTAAADPEAAARAVAAEVEGATG